MLARPKVQFFVLSFVTVFCFDNSWSQPWSQAKRLPAAIKAIEKQEQDKDVEIRGRNETSYQPATKNYIFLDNDSLKIEEETVVKLAINKTSGRRREIFYVSMFDSSKTRARYELLPSDNADVRINIAEGTIIPVMKNYTEVKSDGVDRPIKREKKSVLEIVAANLHAFMYSGSTTRASFTVRPDSTGLVYLAQGDSAITFADSAGLIMKEGEVVHFDKTGSYKLITAAAVVAAGTAAALSSFVNHYSTGIWRPFWQRPWFFGAVGAVGAAAVGGVLILRPPNGQKGLPGPPGLP